MSDVSAARPPADPASPAAPTTTETKPLNGTAANNGAVTRNKRMCRRKAAFKEDYTTKTVNQIKSLRLKGNAGNRATRIPKLPKSPCKAGTNVMIKAKVLQEVPEGLLVMSIQWRGKEYCGCFIDTNKQGWSLPRFDDPKVASIAFLNKKAMLLASDPEDTTDDDYSPKTKRKRGGKSRKGKKRKVKNGDISNGKAIKTPTKSKAGRPSNAEKSGRQQSTEPVADKSDASSDKTTKTEKPIKTEKLEKVTPKPEPKPPTPDVKPAVSPAPEPKPVSTPDKPADKPTTTPVIKTEPSQMKSSTSIPTISSAPPKQVRTEKTATIPVGTLSSSPLLKHTPPPKTVSSPFSTVSSPFSTVSSPFSTVNSPFSSHPHQTNGALVSPLHNHTFPLIVPPPFFIPNFLQSAKFLAEGVKRTQSNEGSSSHPSHSQGISNTDFSGVFAKNSSSVANISTTSSTGANVIVSDNHQLRNK